jgi:predicted ribosome quality control (RQC) complex YloA/Tae2 family protein
LFRQRPANPEEPPTFCMLIRKRIEGGRILAVNQAEWDRVVEILVESTNDIGDWVQYVLVLEIMGKHSNLMLCQADENGRPMRIVDSAVHVTKDMSRVRQVQPGLPYLSAPPQHKKTYEEVEVADVAGLDTAALSDKNRRLALCRLVAGMGPLTAGEVMQRANTTQQWDPEALLDAIRQVYAAASTRCEGATVGLDDIGVPVVAAPYRLTSWNQMRPMKSMDDALDAVYTDVAAKSQLSALAGDLQRNLSEQADKMRGKLQKLRGELEETVNHDNYRIRGELLTAYAFQISKGQTVIELPNFYDDERPLAIELNPAWTAIENANHYFKQGSKRKRGIPLLHAEIEQTTVDLRYLEDTLMHLQDANRENLLAMQKELEQQGFVKAKKSKANPRKTPSTPSQGQPDAYLSEDGFTIRVGRNNLQNDRLTLKSSQDSDIWLHTKDIPGSHVVIVSEKRDIPESTLYEAAVLAAYFSKGRDSTNVAVDYTLIKHVWKPNGARPGFVLYDHQKSLFVNPDRQILDQIVQRQLPR